MHGQPNRLSHGRRGPIREGHQPWFWGSGGKRGDGRDAGTESEAFEGLVEGDCDQEDEERGAGCYGEGHADEDGVEEDAGFEEEALQEELLVERVLRKILGTGG